MGPSAIRIAGRGQQRGGEGGPLDLPAGMLRGKQIPRVAGVTRRGTGPFDRPRAMPPLHPPQLRPHRVPRLERGDAVLRHEPDHAPPQPRPPPPLDHLAVHPHLPAHLGRRRQPPGERRRQHRLTRARPPEHDGDLPGGHHEIHSRQQHPTPPAGIDPHREPPQFGIHRGSPSRRCTQFRSARARFGHRIHDHRARYLRSRSRRIASVDSRVFCWIRQDCRRNSMNPSASF